MRKIVFICIIISAFIATLLEVSYVIMSNKVATQSIEAAKLKEEIALLDEKNSALETEILSLTSYEMVASKAAQLGFKESGKVIVLTPSSEQLSYSAR